MNWVKRLFGYIECDNCKNEFKKTKNSACGWMHGKSVYYCKDCSNLMIQNAFAGKDPFAKVEDQNTTNNVGDAK